jgi:hypothetical protein
MTHAGLRRGLGAIPYRRSTSAPFALRVSAALARYAMIRTREVSEPRHALGLAVASERLSVIARLRPHSRCVSLRPFLAASLFSYFGPMKGGN